MGTIYFIFCIAFGFLYFILTLLILAYPLNPSLNQYPLNVRRKILLDDDGEIIDDSIGANGEAIPLLSTSYPNVSTSSGTITASSHPGENSTASNMNGVSNVPKRRVNKTKWIWISLAFLIFYPLIFFACITLPTW